MAATFPDEAGVLRWCRTARLRRGGQAEVVVDDDWTLERQPEEVALTFMAAGAVQVAGMTFLVTGVEPEPTGRRVAVRLTVKAEGARIKFETVEIDDEMLLQVWGSTPNRLGS